MINPEWREEIDGTFIAETSRFSLVVCRLPKKQGARFLVMARQSTGSDVLVGSGTSESISDAMCTAEEVAQHTPSATCRIRTLVIVADDNDSVRRTVADCLRDSGYQVSEASCGESVLRRLGRTSKPAVVIADINLGDGITGLQLAASVHRLRPGTGVLLISADDKSLANCSGAEEILAKPFSTERLLAHVSLLAARLVPSAIN